MNLHRPMSDRKYYLDGLKGVLCYFIMLGHFWHIYFGIEGESPLHHSFFDAILSLPLADYIFTATFWLYAFLVISGYLVSFSKIGHWRDLISKSVKRFLRLFLPILGASFFIYVIQAVVGFHVMETKEYFTNTWFQQYYAADMSLIEMVIDAVRAMFVPACAFNSPFGVISDMFRASLIIYLCKYVDHLAKRKTHILPWLSLFIAVLIDTQIVLACMCGFMLGYYADFLKRLAKRLPLLAVLTIGVLSCVFIVNRKGFLPEIFDGVLLYILLYCFMMIWIDRLPIIQRILSSRVFLLAGKTSFGVYALHWPIICSVGALCLIKGIQQSLDGRIIYISSLLICTVCTIVLSILYHLTVEKYAMKLVKRIPL